MSDKMIVNEEINEHLKELAEESLSEMHQKLEDVAQEKISTHYDGYDDDDIEQLKSRFKEHLLELFN